MQFENLKMKYLQLTLALSVCFISSCNNTQKMQTNTRAIDLFRQVIVGDFDNSKQVAAEIAAGKQIHPLAKHVNRIANSKIEGLTIPHIDKNLGFWLLEESYYEYPGKPMEIKPYLFYFSQGESNTVKLTVYQFPAGLKKEDIKNSNKNLKIKFTDLKPSPTFKGATYTLEADSCFHTNAPNDLGNGMKFTLIEKMCKEQLQVMELLEKDGKRLTPYDTPIIYDRLK
jgi:hypothetical protein